MVSRCAGLLLVTVFGLVAAGCSSYSHWEGPSSSTGTHTVRQGETLSVIAARSGLDYRDLARWNRLGDGSLIYPGQRIRLTPPSGGSGATSVASRASRPAPPPSDPSPAWEWPTYGKIISEFDGNQGSGTGLMIAGKSGQPVRAAASGRVVYSGSGLIGYGQLIIVKHNNTYLSAYGHNASLLVKEGEAINKGQRIATMGEGPGQEPRLHFEIRRNGKPVDPRQYLPAK